MPVDLINAVSGDVMLGLAQAAGAIALCAAVIALCGWFSVHVEREAAISIARGLVQMVLVGTVLAALLKSALWIGALILLAMMLAATFTAARRLHGIGGAFAVCFCAIAVGSGIVIVAMLATGTLKSDIAMLVPVGSMVIGNAMNACAQAAERFRADVTARVGEIETGLALGPLLPRVAGQCILAVGREELGEFEALLSREACAHAYVLQRSRVIEEAEQQRTNRRALAFLMPSKACNYGVAVTLMLHFEHYSLVGFVRS